MSRAYHAYRWLSTGLFLSAFPGFWAYTRISGRHRRGLRQRLGDYARVPLERDPRRPRIWLHAASVGEVNAAAAIAAALRRRRPGAALVVSTTTEHGHLAACEKLGAGAACVYAPLDWSGAVNRALAAVRPDLLACVETEIWPTWLVAARRRGVRTAIVNGRLSQRSFDRYRRVHGLMRGVLEGIEALSMIGPEDARRVRALGAAEAALQVNGNAKFDLAGEPPDPARVRHFADLFGLRAGAPVIVSGSVRSGETRLLVEAFGVVRRAAPEAVLILAPRHLGRVAQVCATVRAAGLACQRRTALEPPRRPRTAPVVVLDTIGELREVYGVAQAVFCGGSLVPRGGQNLLEAAAAGKPVVCGPHMDDFRAAADLLLASGAAFQVNDAAELGRRLGGLLADPAAARAAGLAGHRTVAANRGAADRHAAVLDDLLLG